MTIPAAPVETGESKRLLFLCESDGAGNLRPVLFSTAANDGALTEGERVQAMAVGGRRADGDPATDGPIPIGIVYKASPSANADGDIISMLGDDRGRVVVVGSAVEGATVVGQLVMVGGRYDATDRVLADGRAGAFATDPAGRMKFIPILADTATALAAVTVGSSTTVALAAQAGRVTATFTNDSDEVIYLALGVSAVMNRGIRLNANGGSYEINLSNPWAGAVNAICASGSKNLCVQQTYRA